MCVSLCVRCVVLCLWCDALLYGVLCCGVVCCSVLFSFVVRCLFGFVSIGFGFGMF